MSKSVVIGVWVEKESRSIHHCPSYYAADYEILRTKPGEYPISLVYQEGYTVPMPYWLTAGIDSDRIEGKLYSGFGGVNYNSQDLPAEPVKYVVQAYSYELNKFVEDGRVKLDPNYDWLLSSIPWKDPRAPKTWAEIK